MEVTMPSVKSFMVTGSVVTGDSIGGELRALRLLRGFSQKELAAAVDISAPQVSQIETGAYTPSLDTLTRFLEVLDAHLVIELDEGGLFDPSSGSQEPPAQPTP